METNSDERRTPIALTKIRDMKNSEPDRTDLMAYYQKCYMSGLGVDSSSDSFNYMLAQAMKYYRKYEEAELRQLISNAQNGDENSLNKIITSHLLIPFHVLHKYFGSEFWKEDLIQEGNIAIQTAVLSFDLTRENKFSSFLYQVIKNAMHVFLYNVNPKVSTTKPSKKLREHISTTELNNLARNFVDLSDLKQRITRFPRKIQRMIVEYVLEKQYQIISYEEHYDEILEEISSGVGSDYVSDINRAYTANYEALHDYVTWCATNFMSLRRFYIYCEFNGLFGFQPPINIEKRLKELDLSIHSIDALNKIMLENVYLNEDFEGHLVTLTRNLQKARGYYYERI